MSQPTRKARGIPRSQQPLRLPTAPEVHPLLRATLCAREGRALAACMPERGPGDALLLAQRYVPDRPHCSREASPSMRAAITYSRTYSQAAIFLHEELGGAQAMGGALIVAANLLA